MFFSADYFLYMIPGLILVLLAQWFVNSTHRKWSQVRNSSNISGAEAAKRLMHHAGLSGVSLEPSPGKLTDHYDPRSKALRLSAPVAEGQSVASLAIAAHEIGHAMQDKHDYLPLRFRAALVPAVNIGSRLGFILIFIGLIIRGVLGTQLAWIGVGTFGLGAFFSLATLPVELNASARARSLLADTGLIRTAEEKQGVNAVLTAAALTYVAALAAAVFQLLYYLSLVTGMRGRRRG